MQSKRKKLNEEPSIEEQERLIEIMNDSPRLVSFNDTQWELRALKPGTQWLIAKEAIAINKAESANYMDIIKQFAINIPSVARVITLGLLNDREKIFVNGDTNKGYTKLFDDTYNTILWDTDQSGWMQLMVEMFNLIDIEVFFSLTSSITILRQKTLERKKTMEEQRLLSPVPSGDR